MPCAQRNPCVFICYTIISTTVNLTMLEIRCDHQLKKIRQIDFHICSICFEPNQGLIERLTLKQPIGKHLNLKFLGGDWRRRERSSGIGETGNLPYYWRRGQQLWV